MTPHLSVIITKYFVAENSNASNLIEGVVCKSLHHYANKTTFLITYSQNQVACFPMQHVIFVKRE